MKARTMAHSLVFYDIEASGLDGAPIEIGWAFSDPKTGDIQAEALLIRPDVTWRIEAVWDDAAEQVHCISLAQLHMEGRSPIDVAHRMNEALDGRELCSDAPTWDMDWLRMIFDAAKIEPRFSVNRYGAHVIIGTMARDHGWSAAACQSVMAKIETDYPRTHRAADDALHLAALCRALMQGPSAS